MKGLAWLLCLTVIYATILAAITVLNWSGADRQWLGALNLYLPQAMWAVPGIVLAVLFFRIDRFWLWLPLLCVAWVLGPIMDLRWAPSLARVPGESVQLRLMTWNVKYGSYDLAPLVGEITRYKPDIVLFQDAVGALDGPLSDFFRDWQVRFHGQYLIASRFPLSPAEVHRIPSTGEGQEFLRCRAQVGQHSVAIYNVHLKTPRWSLNAFRTARRQPWYLPEAIQKFDHNINTRLTQAEAVRAELARETGPVLLAGDLNSPDASQAVGTLREAGLHDAFAERGRGYGFTYGHFLFKNRLPWLKISWMRIDHVMISRHFLTRSCWTGTGQGSDHRPVIADLVLQTSR